MLISRLNLAALACLVVNPILSFLVAVLYIYKRREYPSFVLSASISLIYLYQPIPWDVRSIFYIVSDGARVSDNLYFYGVSFLQKYFSLEYMQAIGIFIFISVFLGLSLLNKCIKISSRRASFAVMLFSLYMLLDYRYVFDLSRTYLAVILAAYIFVGCYRYSNFIFAAFSVLIHPFAAVLYFSKGFLKVNFLSNGWLLFFVVISPLFSVILVAGMAEIISRYPGDIFVRLAYYLEGPGSRYSSESIFLAVTVTRFVSILLALYAYSKCELSERGTARFRLLLLLGGVYGCFILNATISERLYLMFSIFLGFMLLCDYLKPRWRYLVVPILSVHIVLLFHMFTVFYSTKYNDVVTSHSEKISLSLKPLYYPTTSLIDVGSNGYSNDFIREKTNAR